MNTDPDIITTITTPPKLPGKWILERGTATLPLSAEDADRLEFCKKLKANIANPELPIIDPWMLRLAYKLVAEPQPLLENQREAIDKLRARCEDKF